jgi:peptide/nickel transport system permease protein
MTDATMPTPTVAAAAVRALRSFGLLRESWVGMIGAGLIVFWVVMALLAPLIAPFEPNATLQPFAKPGTAFANGGTFWLGTDQIGRDILSRIIWGSRTVLFYAPLATLCAYVVGILMGLAAGYRRGWWDTVLSRVSDIILSFPVLVLYIVIITTIGPSGVGFAQPRVCRRGPNPGRDALVHHAGGNPP